MNHTQEPWCVNESASGDIFISGADQSYVAEMGCPDDEATLIDARRIVACVNACAGICTELLNPETDEYANLNQMVGNLIGQRDELLDAIKRVLSLPNLSSGHAHKTPTREQRAEEREAYQGLHAAIAKAEGRS